MFTIRFMTEQYAPGQTVTLRWAPNWDLERGGVFKGGAWTFDLDEAAFPNGIEFKFVLTPARWMLGQNLFLARADLAGVHDYVAPQIAFQPVEALVTENGLVAQRFFVRNLDPNHEYDVIVVGSGMGGGLLASRLAEGGADVLVLEAGSFLFPTHIGNLPRRLRIGQFDKHVWSLWPDFKVKNFVNGPGSEFAGAQAFNLGGRSVFWGGLIPRQVGYELAAWPAAVRDYLLGLGYPAAERVMNVVPPAPSNYQAATRAFLQNTLPGYAAEDAPIAVQYRGATRWSIPAGFFSTADLLMEDRLLDGLAAAQAKPTVNLNFAVWRVVKDTAAQRRAVGVEGWDLLGQKARTFKAKKVVLAAGTIESAKIALQSGLVDPSGKIGKGITDHTIRYRHFTLPPGAPQSNAIDSAKVILRHPTAADGSHAFDIVVELGSDFNQGRYIDPENLARERAARADWMLCELVFMSYSALNEGNAVAITGNPADPVGLAFARSMPSAADLAEQDALAAQLFATIGAQPVLGENSLALQFADLGGVAHEVGTLRMSGNGTGVVDADLKFEGYDNLYACDNSVFPASPAANPSLTLAALAMRLAAQLTTAG
ncbi:GMC family oxidoreductase [Hyphomicrobiales bacterium]|jgi:choline dehydrogenase-like flavoprotein|uniref:GMC oxidoreductase n=1 Tax=unclassified Rhizobium TaxID=2613769 RepID=UPI000DDD9F36